VVSAARLGVLAAGVSGCELEWVVGSGSGLVWIGGWWVRWFFGFSSQRKGWIEC
jgi:hypothetical protein